MAEKILASKAKEPAKFTEVEIKGLIFWFFVEMSRAPKMSAGAREQKKTPATARGRKKAAKPPPRQPHVRVFLAKTVLASRKKKKVSKKALQGWRKRRPFSGPLLRKKKEVVALNARVDGCAPQDARTSKNT